MAQGLLHFVFLVLTFLILDNSFLIVNGNISQDPNVIYPLLTTTLGQLRGTVAKSRAGKLFFSYHGIPYSQPAQRFQPARPAQPWKNILDARNLRSVCPQMSGAKVIGEEDCLFLSIHFPYFDRCTNETGKELLPVIFNIHGGAYKAGSGGIFSAKYLLDECVVFVSINYRLGALGFMTTSDEELPGNLGLKDQVLALQWIQSYITSFRGDPNLVTIVGMSAGASSVSHHIASVMSKGLFHRAIAASGTALAPWSIQRNPHLYAQHLGRTLNCTVSSSSALKECLKSKPFSTIVAKEDRGDGAVVSFGPTIETSASLCPFQTKHPAVILRDGDFNRVPFMTGFVEDEGITILAGLVLSSKWIVDLVNRDWDKKASLWFLYDQLNLTQTEMSQISSKIRSFYFGDKPIGEETRQNLTNLYSDRYFIQSAFETVELHSKFAPAYSYVYTYKGGRSGAAGYKYEIPVVTHGDDAQFIFGGGETAVGTEQFEFSRNLIKHWVHFAIHGKPDDSHNNGNWAISTGNSNAVWHQLDLPESNYANYLASRRQFWQKLGLYEHELWS